MQQSIVPELCPDCHGQLEEIHILARGARDPFTHNALEVVVEGHVSMAATRNCWTGEFKSTGQLHTFRCGTCCRVFVYAFPIPAGYGEES